MPNPTRKTTTSKDEGDSNGTALIRTDNQHFKDISTASLPDRYSNELTQKQIKALTIHAMHQDPFFTVHQAMHAIKAEVVGERTIPLNASETYLECQWFSDCTAVTLQRMFHIEKRDLFQVQLGILLPSLNLNTCGNHVVLYVRNGLKFLPGSQQGDIFFDSTCSQFSRGTLDTDRKERVLEYLKKHGGNDGSNIADALQRRGYVKIPSSEVGKERLGLLLSAYVAKNSWPSSPKPIEQELLYDKRFDSNALEGESYFESIYNQRQAPRDANSYYDGWSSAEHFFEPGALIGELRLSHPSYRIDYLDNWHDKDI